MCPDCHAESIKHLATCRKKGNSAGVGCLNLIHSKSLQDCLWISSCKMTSELLEYPAWKEYLCTPETLGRARESMLTKWHGECLFLDPADFWGLQYQFERLNQLCKCCRYDTQMTPNKSPGHCGPGEPPWLAIFMCRHALPLGERSTPPRGHHWSPRLASPGLCPTRLYSLQAVICVLSLQ